MKDAVSVAALCASPAETAPEQTHNLLPNARLRKRRTSLAAALPNPRRAFDLPWRARRTDVRLAAGAGLGEAAQAMDQLIAECAGSTYAVAALVDRARQLRGSRGSSA